MEMEITIRRIEMKHLKSSDKPFNWCRKRNSQKAWSFRWNKMTIIPFSTMESAMTL